MSRREVKSAVRSLDVLYMFAVERRALPQHEIVKLLSYPQSSATFLLKTMVDAGYLIYDPTERTYFPTPKVLSIGDWLRETDYGQMDGDSPLANLIHQLEDLVDETICISMQNDTNVYWHRVIARNLPTDLYCPEGQMYALTHSCHGWMLMSRLNEDRVDRTCRLINSREPNTRLRVDPDLALRRVENIRQEGHFYHRNTFLVGGAGVAMLLPGTVAGRVVTVGIGGTVERIERKLDHIVPNLEATVSEYGARIAAGKS